MNEGEIEGRLTKRVLPPEAVKAGEVAIGRAQDKSMLNGERGDVGIGYEVGPTLGAPHEWREHFLMANGWQGNPGRLRGQPRFHLLPRRHHG